MGAVSREAVFIVDRGWNIVHASSGSAKMFGRTQKALLQSSVFALLPERLRANQKKLWATAGRESLRVDALGSKRGEEFPLKVEVARVPDHEELACVILSDLRTVNSQSQKMEALGLLAGGVAHDFNNALTAIIGFASGVRDELDLESPLRADLEEVVTAAQSASQLTTQLLSFSRQRAVQSSIIEVNRSVDEMQRLLRKTLPASIQISILPSRDDVHVRFELSELHQILINLASNARDAMADGGELEIRVNTRDVVGLEGLDDGEYAIIDVADTGGGIPKELLGKIFDPFFSTKGEDGTGLGLSTCFGLARQASGTLAVTSKKGHGTTFSLFLPKCASAPLRSLTTTQGIKLRRNYGSALVVEDQPAVRKYLVRSIKKVGLTVVEVGSAEEALLAYDAMATVPELLVTDVMLSGRSGTDLAEALLLKNPNLKVLLISGHIGPSAGSESLSKTNTRFLGKPFTVKQMRRSIETLLNPPNRLDGHIVVVAPTILGQQNTSQLFADVNLKRVLLSSLEETVAHLSASEKAPSLVCISSQLPAQSALGLVDAIRHSDHYAAVPIVIMDSLKQPFVGDRDRRTALLADGPTELQLREVLFELGLQLAS
jgi:signal transduction histidine kinase/CheY-like chemotaxis protein